MTAHLHPKFVPGCYRCDLSRDEAQHALADEVEELEARVQKLRNALRMVADWSSEVAAANGNVGVREYAKAVLHDD